MPNHQCVIYTIQQGPGSQVASQLYVSNYTPYNLTNNYDLASKCIVYTRCTPHLVVSEYDTDMYVHLNSNNNSNKSTMYTQVVNLSPHSLSGP